MGQIGKRWHDSITQQIETVNTRAEFKLTAGHADFHVPLVNAFYTFNFSKMMAYQTFNVLLLKAIKMLSKSGFNKGNVFNINKPDS